ncbi:YciI family protein [Paracoccus sp. DK608]|uniref:YciI family protein n=2 Tax=Paracoccus shanxieyensis TaxID=2675752 RepID=A0A6L6IT40_9RHOB|nr:YciI family protein [Paracoccus shanxieyensis]MTH87257.1 YciI family protein [Paracoccus shanxieyensis]
MPLFAVICRDNPGQLQTRLDTRDAHLAFLKAQPGLRMAGPLLEDGEMRGSLLIVEFDDLAAAQDWAAGDPYKAAGLFQSSEVIEWKKVIG